MVPHFGGRIFLHKGHQRGSLCAHVDITCLKLHRTALFVDRLVPFFFFLRL